MAIDTFMAYVGVYNSVSDADADYELVKDLHTKEGLIDAYDAAVVERRTILAGARHAQDSETGNLISRHSGATRSIEPGISNSGSGPSNHPGMTWTRTSQHARSATRLRSAVQHHPLQPCRA